MKKILIAFDNAHFSKGAFEAARFINKSEPIVLVGVFLPAVYYANSFVAADGASGPFFVPLVESEDIEVVEKNIALFTDMCEKNNIRYVVHKNLPEAVIPSLKLETRFADLMIIGSEMFYRNLGRNKPNEYLRYALHESECPVLLVPERFVPPVANMLAYTDDASSVFAIKEFKLLFPQWCQHKTYLLHAAGKKEDGFPERSYIEEYARTSFTDLELSSVDFDSRKYFATWISEKDAVLLVSGSYSRSEFSEFFKKSFVADVIGEHSAPVFIAHK